MKFCVTDEHGHPTAFYDDGLHKSIPGEAFEISKKDWLECIEHQGCRRFDSDGRLVECVRPTGHRPTSAEMVSNRLESDKVLSALLDVVSEQTGVQRSDLEESIVERMEAG